MFINFAKKLFELLVADEFSYIKQENNILVYETGALSFYKDKGSIIYIVTVVNAKQLERERYDVIIDKYSGILDEDNRAQVVLMNIIVDDVEHKFVIDEDFLPGKKTYIFTYNVDLETKEMKVSDEQPDLLEMESKVLGALGNYDGSYVNGTHLTALQQQVKSKYALPVRSENCYLTLFLIGVNILLWILTELIGSSADADTLISFGALTRELVINQKEYYRLMSSVFIHAGLAHLANNCLSLYIFGSRIERHFGKFCFITTYITAGIIGNLLTIYFLPDLSVGASGAIFGILGVILSVSYRTGRSVGNLSPYVIVLLCVYAVGSGFVMRGVNNFAHIGGFVTGLLVGSFIKTTSEDEEPELKDTQE